MLVQAGSGALTLGTPSSPGIPEGCTQDTLLLEYNDAAGVQAAFDSNGEKIACVILEPVVGNMGVVVPTEEFLTTLREQCTKHGAVLIFDEVMTGFRVAYGGAQSHFGITPDMTTLGKIVGGGLPVGAYGGRRDMMEQISPVGPVYQAGTLSGNPLATAAGLATLTQLRDDNPYPALAEKAQHLVDGLSSIAADLGIEHTVANVGSMFTFFFNSQPVSNFSISANNRTDLFAKYFHGMLENGIYLPCSQFEANFVSVKHTDSDIQQTLDAAKIVLQHLAAESS